MDALREVQVRHNERERDGFQLTFAVGRSSPVEYDLLASGLLDPPARVIICVIFNVMPEVLIDGIITDHQVTPSSRPGESQLTVSGVDVSVMMDLEEKNATYPNQSDSVVVTRLIGGYAQYGLMPAVTPTADVQTEQQHTPTQQGTDYQHIQRLAERNGYVFYVEPTRVPGVNTAYWGPQTRGGAPQPALTLHVGGQNNVDSPVHARFDALGPASPQVSILEANTGLSIPIPVPGMTGLPLALRPATSLRRTLSRDTANLTPARAAARALAAASEGANAVTLNGTVNAVRYGHVLRPRRLVGLSGVGMSYGGLHYVQQVTHRIRRGEYEQSFMLIREGRGATVPAVLP
jgi:hypothetical protein